MGFPAFLLPTKYYVSLPFQTQSFCLCSKHEELGSTNLPILIKLEAFFTSSSLRTKGRYKAGEMRQIPPPPLPDKGQVQGAFPSIIPKTKAPLVIFSPFLCKLLPGGPGGLEEATAGTRGRAELCLSNITRDPPLRRGLSPAPALGAQLRALCFHLIKCLLICSRHFDILGRTLLDKDYKKNVLLL